MVAAVAAGITWLTSGAIAGTAATIASSALLYAGTTAAAYFIEQANQPKQDIGTKLHATSGGAVNQSIIVGEKETAGSLIYSGSWGQPGKTPNGLYVRVFCLQDMPSSDYLARCWTSDNKGTLDKSHINYTDALDSDYPADGTGYSGSGQSIGHPITSLDHDGNHYGWVKILTGQQVAADPYLLAKFGLLADRPWTSSMIGRGRTLMIVTQRYTVKEANEVKNVAAVVQGMALYDWRKDSTNGGSGAHRWGDAITYEYTANPIVILYNVMRGIYWGGTWIYGGLNWPARRFDNDSWTAAANVCDQNVTLASGATEKRYRMGAEINLGEPPLTVMDRILATFSGRLVESGGIYKVYAGGIGASVYSFTDADVIITEPLTGKMFPSRAEICNTITGSYCEPDNGGQMKAYSKRTKAEYVANDNDEPLSRPMDFDYVRGNTQAQRLALHALNDNRRFLTKTIALPSIGRKLEPGDVVNWSDSVRFGFTNKKMITGDVTMTNRGVVLAILREADATDADWSVGDEKPYTVGVYGDIVPDNQTLDITVTATAIKKGDGSDKDPAVKVTWPTDADMVDCKWVRLQVRLLGLSSSVFAVDPVVFDEGRAIITKGIRLNEVYEVRARIIPYSDRNTDWSDWEVVTANVGHGVTVDDVEDSAPATLASPSVTRRTNVLRDGRTMTNYSINWDDSNTRLTYDIRILDTTLGDLEWKHVKRSPQTVELIPLHDYSIQVRAVSKLGIPGTLSSAVTFTVPKKSASDGNVPDPTGVTATGNKAGIIVVDWDDPQDSASSSFFADYARSEVRWVNNNATGPGGATFLGTFVGSNARHTGLNGGVDRWYFVRHFDKSENPSGWTPNGAPGRKGTTAKLQSGDIDTGEIKAVNIGLAEVHSTHIGNKEVKTTNIDDEAVDDDQIKVSGVHTKKIQKGAVTGKKMMKESFRTSLGGNKRTHNFRNGKTVSNVNQSGAVEFIILSGGIGVQGKIPATGGGMRSAGVEMQLVASYRRDGGAWRPFFTAKGKFIGKASTTIAGTFQGSRPVDYNTIPGAPKMGSKLEVKATVIWQALGQPSGVKCFCDLTIAISSNRR